MADRIRRRPTATAASDTTDPRVKATARPSTTDDAETYPSRRPSVGISFTSPRPIQADDTRASVANTAHSAAARDSRPRGRSGVRSGQECDDDGQGGHRQRGQGDRVRQAVVHQVHPGERDQQKPGHQDQRQRRPAPGHGHGQCGDHRTGGLRRPGPQQDPSAQATQQAADQDAGRGAGSSRQGNGNDLDPRHPVTIPRSARGPPNLSTTADPELPADRSGQTAQGSAGG